MVFHHLCRHEWIPIWFNFLCRCRAFPGLNTLVYNVFFSCCLSKICGTLHHKQMFIEVENVIIIIWYIAKLAKEFHLSISIWLLRHFRWLWMDDYRMNQRQSGSNQIISLAHQKRNFTTEPLPRTTVSTCCHSKLQTLESGPEKQGSLWVDNQLQSEL